MFHNCESLILNSELIKFEKEIKILLNFILIGDRVGKSSLLYKLTDGDFIKYIPSNPIDFRFKLIKKEIEKNNEFKKKKIYKLTIWDTSERYERFRKPYYKRADACIILYDISERRSFDNIKYYYDEFKKENSNAIIYLFGNKIDLIGKRKVEIKKAKEICEKYNIIWGGEYSAKTSRQEDLINVFEEIIKSLNLDFELDQILPISSKILNL